jgi:hypothetical protein
VNIASDPVAKLSAPTAFRALANAGTVTLTFDAPENSVTFIVKSSSDNKGSEAKQVGEPSDSNLVLVKVPNAEKLFYQVTAVNRNGTGGTPTDWISPTAQPSVDKKKPTGVSLY